MHSLCRLDKPPGLVVKVIFLLKHSWNHAGLEKILFTRTSLREHSASN